MVMPPHHTELGVKVLHDQKDADVDIIAIHGMNGVGEHPWTADNGVLWLRDLLPSILPRARIAMYGYIMSSNQSSPIKTMYNIAENLVSRLAFHREATSTKNRPIIFIAHSLGGVILKFALIHASRCHVSHLGHHRQIVQSTYGVLFLATPQEGTAIALSASQLLKAFPAPAQESTTVSLLRNLISNADILETMLSEYNTINIHFTTKFFYEIYKTALPDGKSEFILPKASAIITGAVNTESIGLQKNHKDISKFTSVNDDDFVTLAWILRGMASSLMGGHVAHQPSELYSPHARLQEQVLPPPYLAYSTSDITIATKSAQPKARFAKLQLPSQLALKWNAIFSRTANSDEVSSISPGMLYSHGRSLPLIQDYKIDTSVNTTTFYEHPSSYSKDLTFDQTHKAGRTSIISSISDVASSASSSTPSLLQAFSKQSNSCLDGQIYHSSEHAVMGGGYADIWTGELGHNKVAIKTIRCFSSMGLPILREKLLKRLWREYLVWSQLKHPNILQCLGYSYDFTPSSLFKLPALVSPWMSNGNALTYIISTPDIDRLLLIKGITDGLAFLHACSPPVIHGDIRAGNILVSADGIPCLTDFGLSRILGDTLGMTTSSNVAGSLRWMSHELLNNEKADTKSDIWAFGMTVLEILTAKQPYAEIKLDAAVLMCIINGKLPLQPEVSVVPVLTDEIWMLCNQCWTFNPTDRPTIHELQQQYQI